MTRVLSGIQPTGDIHLGNYLGAVQRWVADQHAHDALYCAVDLHALTVPQPPGVIGPRTLDTMQVLLAAGLDPEVCTLFVQSHVPEHTELSWLLNCVATMGELGRMTQFKDKAGADDRSSGQDSVTVGFFDYPVLMAADILAYEADRVPVGEDQRQHLELCREIARRFNHRYGPTFVVPEGAIAEVGARIKDLQEPDRKMSKSAESAQGRVLVLDDPATIERKIKRAVTDAETDVLYDPERRPGVSNLLSILGLATGRSPQEVAEGYTRYGPLKADTAAAVIELLAPVQERYAALSADPGETVAILRRGADKARAIASVTVARARDAVGLLSR